MAQRSCATIRRKIYALAMSARHADGRVGIVVGGTMNGRNTDEAEGIGVGMSKSAFPPIEGWKEHVCHASAIPDDWIDTIKHLNEKEVR